MFFFLQPTNVRAVHNYGDLDPFKFRWLIPLSALQVRLGNTAGNPLGLNTLALNAFLGFVILLLPYVFLEPLETGRCGENTICCCVLHAGELDTLTDFLHLVCWVLPQVQEDAT